MPEMSSAVAVVVRRVKEATFHQLAVAIDTARHATETARRSAAIQTGKRIGSVSKRSRSMSIVTHRSAKDTSPKKIQASIA